MATFAELARQTGKSARGLGERARLFGITAPLDAEKLSLLSEILSAEAARVAAGSGAIVWITHPGRPRRIGAIHFSRPTLVREIVTGPLVIAAKSPASAILAHRVAAFDLAAEVLPSDPITTWRPKRAHWTSHYPTLVYLGAPPGAPLAAALVLLDSHDVP
jgi:hypothetical protein